MLTINKALGKQFEHVGYIYGGDNNEMGITNDKYLEKHKQITSSVLINCRILNEGYDDKSIDGVVMATPTNSILYYMQCIGRVVRSNPADNTTKAHVIELTDKLPNVKYKIDNRWLYAEISDYLEPEVYDIPVIDSRDYKDNLSKLIKKYNLTIKNKTYDNFDGESLLLFNSMPQENEHIWRHLFFEMNSREKYAQIFNTISNNIDFYYEKKNFDWILKNVLNVEIEDKYFSERGFKVGFFKALNEAYNQKVNKEKVTGLIYITFYKKKVSWLHMIWRKFIGLFR